MIVVRRVIRSSSSALFASEGWLQGIDKSTKITKALPDANWQSTSYYNPNNRNARRQQKSIDRHNRRIAKVDQRIAYDAPETPIRPDPIYEHKVRQYQFEQSLKNPPNTNQVWDDFAEDMGKAREKFSQATNNVKDSVKPNFTDKAKLNPKLLLAGLGVAGVVGTGAYFIRRRRSKNGKQIVERVRR